MVESKFTNILSTTVLSDIHVAEYRGSPVADQFRELHEQLERVSGADAASLLAYPEMAVSRNRNVEVITWYTDLEGDFRTYDQLSESEAAAVDSLLTRQLQACVDQADSSLRDLMSVALNVPGPQGIHFNGETVVLTEWGLVSDTRDGSNAAPTALAAFLPAGFVVSAMAGVGDGDGDDSSAPDDTSSISDPSAPEVADQQSAAAAGSQTPPLTARSTQGETASTLGTETYGGGPGVVVGEAAPDRRAIYWTIGATLFLLLFLLYMLWPGNLVYPASTALLDDEAALLTRRSTNEALVDHTRRLQEALGNDVCVVDDRALLDRISGLPVMPDNQSVPPSGAPRQPGNVPADNPEATEPDAQNSERSDPATPNDAAAPTEQSVLLDRLDKGTVFIVGSTETGLSMGSGILVSPRHVLTNHHVIKETDGRHLIVSNQHLETPISAKVTARSPNADIASNDFAILELEREIDLPRLSVTPSAERLDSVFAAGYPSFVLSSDPNFVVAFRDGDLSRLKTLQMAVTRGEITAMQPGQSANRILAHSATISPGNSGGPLVDLCGRVVGVNTFTKTDSEHALRLNFALSSQDAISFLTSNNISVEADTSVCVPTAPAPVSLAPSPQDAAGDRDEPQAPSPPPVASRGDDGAADPDAEEAETGTTAAPPPDEADSLIVPDSGAASQ